MTEAEFENIDHAIMIMKQKVINTDSDKNDVVNAMQSTMKYRRNWVLINNHSITDILERFPKFIELPFLVKI